MPTPHPRVNVVFEEPLYAAVQRLAAQDGVSMSMKVRDLVRCALEDYEDSLLLGIAEARSRTFKRSKAVPHDKAWK
ncbi:MAG TPA: antitoxin, RHH family protein [Elusimicrobia bacterium]|nr:antitoxin, RHH family protein [Elusimicrobiota bacterium]